MSSEDNEINRNRTASPDYGNNYSSAVTADSAEQDVQMACVHRCKNVNKEQVSIYGGCCRLLESSGEPLIGQDRM